MDLVEIIKIYLIKLIIFIWILKKINLKIFRSLYL